MADIWYAHIRNTNLLGQVELWRCSSWGINSSEDSSVGSVCPCPLPPQPNNKSEIQQHSVQKACMAHSTSRLTLIPVMSLRQVGCIDLFHHKFSHKCSRCVLLQLPLSILSWTLKAFFISIQRNVTQNQSAQGPLRSCCIMHVGSKLQHRFVSTLHAHAFALPLAAAADCPWADAWFLSHRRSRSVSWSD